MKNFLLNKYYMDCVTDSGQVIVAYASEITWGMVHIRHSSFLISDGNRPNTSRTTFFKGRMPLPTDYAWRWNCPALDAEGIWSGIAGPHPGQLLHETPDGKKVVWNCLCPLAQTEIRLGKNTYAGKGYVERLTLTLEPWLLPVDTLHWGRFHGDEGSSLTWIFWQGPHPLALLFDNRGIIPLRTDTALPVLGDRYEWDDNRLTLNRETILRQGDISTTALKCMPGAFRSLFPQRILHLKETKWAGTGSWRHEASIANGFAIHEIVDFRQPCCLPTV